MSHGNILRKLWVVDSEFQISFEWSQNKSRGIGLNYIGLNWAQIGHLSKHRHSLAIRRVHSWNDKNWGKGMVGVEWNWLGSFR